MANIASTHVCRQYDRLSTVQVVLDRSNTNNIERDDSGIGTILDDVTLFPGVAVDELTTKSTGLILGYGTTGPDPCPAIM